MKPFLLKAAICFAFLFICTVVLANAASRSDKTLDKLISEAIARGKEANGSYLIVNSKPVIISSSDLAFYLKQQGYVSCGCSSHEIYRFGAYIQLVDTMSFVPENEVSNFVYDFFRHGKGVPYSELKGPGSFVYPRTKTATWTGNEFPTDEYETISGILWSGEVVDGILHGEGVGIIPAGGDSEFFEATFDYGFPVSRFEGKKLTIWPTNDPEVKSTKIYFQVPTDKVYTLANLTPQVAYVKQVYSKNHISLDAGQVEALYDKILTLNKTTPDYTQFVKENIGDLAKSREALQKQYDLYSQTGVDNRGILEKIRTLFDAYTALNGLTMPLDSRYVTGLFNQRWDQAAADKDKKTMYECIDFIYAKSKETGNVLQPFYQRADPVIRERTRSLANHIYDMVVQWNESAEIERAERERREAQWAKTIDVEESYGPSGELDRGIFDTYWYHKKQGEVRFKFKGGNYLYYNICYREKDLSTKVHYVVVSAGGKLSGLSHKTYDSYEAMINDILRTLQ